MTQETTPDTPEVLEEEASGLEGAFSGQPQGAQERARDFAEQMRQRAWKLREEREEL